MNILVRLPNWLGDLVMSIPFLEHLKSAYPQGNISVIVKKELAPLLDYLPAVTNRFTFSKSDHPGITGVYRFGKDIGRQMKYDIFFALPDSLSSAVMGWASGAKQRVGYSREGRFIFLTRTYKKMKDRHRVNQYADLLQQFVKKQLTTTRVKVHNLPHVVKNNTILGNIHSEAVSRRLPGPKAVSILSHLRQNVSNPITLIGGPNDVDHAKAVLEALPDKTNITDKVGATALIELPLLMNEARVMLSTDSGPAHLANAVGMPLVVLFGAGDESSTAPYNEENRTIIRLGQLPCEPCVRNTCIYGLPKCLELLEERKITDAVINLLK